MTQDAEPETADTADEAAETPKIENVSVVYFHGMGSQRRFEETSRLIDRIDTYLDSAYARGRRRGNMPRIAPRAEKGVGPDDPDVNFIRAVHLKEFRNWDGPTVKARFYEAYWADEMRDERSVRAVMRWILRQVWRPVTMLWSPWRAHQRTRRAALIELYESPEDWPEGTLEGDFEKLLDLYRQFDHPTWTRRAQEIDGHDKNLTSYFSGFLRLIQDRYPGKTGRVARLTRLARAWRKRYLLSEIRNFGFLSSMLLAIILITGLLSAAVFGLLLRVPLIWDRTGLTGNAEIPDWAAATPLNAVTIAVAVLLFVGLRSFLVHRLADVEAWSTYSETDSNFAKREAVLKKSVALLTHVVQQPDCDRVVVVAHSLGTSVAYDTLLAAVHANRAVNAQNTMEGRVDFTRISHFVTLASPVDKISYFFESFRSPIRRFRRVYDEIRGDIGTPPFTDAGGTPRIHWVNIWDTADVISGPLHAPAPRKWTDNHIDNVHVNTLAYFNPGGAHNAYFDSYPVIEMLYDIIFHNRGKYDSTRLAHKIRPDGRQDGLDYRAADLGPGEGHLTWRLPLLFGALTPWSWLAYVIFRALEMETAAQISFWGAVAVTAVPVLAVLRRLGQRQGVADPL